MVNTGNDAANKAQFQMTDPVPSTIVGASRKASIADFNDDGRDDLVWQSVGPNGNDYYLALGTETGLEYAGHDDFGGAWSTYTAHAGDVTGDGAADLVMPRTRADFGDFGIYFAPGLRTSPYLGNRRYTAADAENDVAIAEVLFEAADLGPAVHLIDVSGDDRADLVFDDLGVDEPLAHRIGVGLGRDDGTFSFARVTQQHPARHDWTSYQTYFADVNADGRADVLWILSGPTNTVYVGTAQGN
jgi:hypothetical protein